MAWAFSPDVDEATAVAVLEFVRGQVLVDPDFGEEIAPHTRGATVSGTEIVVIWTFDPRLRMVEVITPLV